MAESTTNEHEANESDEDCEVYFLKPVNEYNIVDKIKEANKVLFEEQIQISEKAPKPKVAEAVDGDTSTTYDIAGGAATRKVTFAPNLETYAPDHMNAETLKLTREFDEALADAKELDRKLTNICAYETIVEEANGDEENTNDDATKTTTTIEQSNTETALAADVMKTEMEANKTIETTSINENATKKSARTESHAEDDIVEEICEEIVVMDMENERKNAEVTRTANAKTRRMYKLPTFDCAEEDPPVMIEGEAEKEVAADQGAGAEDEIEEDNKSLVNLLTSDGEEECCSAATFDINVDNSDLDVDDIDADTYTQEDNQRQRSVTANTDDDAEAHSINTSDDITHTDGFGDDEEDDDLSIIVASYLPNDYDDQKKKGLARARGGSGRLKSTNNKSRHLLAPLSKRFSFRRKVHARNAIGTEAVCTSESGAAEASVGDYNRMRRPLRHQPPPEVTDLKLNYRTCCEYRRQLSQPEKLPKYTGYLSEYGLSRQQLELREESLQRKQRFVLQQALKVNDSEMRKMQDNERAFTTWLRNKMRFPINKTRNMFDMKRRSLERNMKGGGGGVGNSGSGGACGGNNAMRNASGKRK